MLKKLLLNLSIGMSFDGSMEPRREDNLRSDRRLSMPELLRLVGWLGGFEPGGGWIGVIGLNGSTILSDRILVR
jgi:hypothetical protein